MVPRLVARDFPAWLLQRYGLHLTFGSIDFNPFRFDFEAKDLDLSDADGAPLLQAASLAINYAPAGLFRHTWTFDHVTVTGFRADLALAKDGSLNLVELVKRLVPSDKSSTGLPWIAIDRLSVLGSVKFSDLRGATSAITSILPISFGMRFSTVPGEKSKQTFSATLPDGATLREHGELVLKPALSVQGKFALQGVQAKHWLPFIQNDLRIARLEGNTDLSATYRYGADEGLQLDNATLHVGDLLLEASGLPTPLIAMKTIDVTGGKLALAKHNASFSRVSLAQGHASLSITDNGRVSWTELSRPASATASAAAASSAAGADWHLGVSTLRLDHVGFSYDDRQRQPPLIAKVGSLDGNLQLTVDTGSHSDLKTEHITLTAHDVALPALAAGEPALKLDSIALQDGSFDLARKQIAAQEVSIKGGDISVARDADGSIDWARRFASKPGRKVIPASANAGWHYDIAKGNIDGVSIAMKDRSLAPAFDYGVRIESARAQHLTNAGQEPIPFETTLSADKGGTLHAKGSVASSGADLQVGLRFDKLALAPFKTLVRHYTGFNVTSDPLTLAANVHNLSKPVVDNLDFTVANLAVSRQPGAGPLLAVGRLQAHGGQVDLAKRRVVIEQLTLARGAASAMMQPDGKLDWEIAANRPTSMRPKDATASDPWNVRIEALTVSQMAAHYADARETRPLYLNIDRVELGMGLQMSAGGGSTQVVAKNIEAKVDTVGLSIDKRESSTLALKSATLSGGTFDLAARRMTADRLVLAGGETRIVRDAQGRFVLLDSFGSGASSTATPPALVKKSAPWDYAVENLQVQNFGIEADDQSFTPPLALKGHVDATVEKLANRSSAAFDATLSIAESGGNLHAKGTVSPATGTMQADVVAKSLMLMPLQPLISRYTTLALRSGSVGSNLKIQYASGASGSVRATGQVRVDKLALDETAQGSRFLALEQLDAQQIDFNSDARRLSVGEVDLLSPDTRIAIAKDRSINLTDVIKQGAAETPPDTATRSSSPAPASASSFAIGVQRVRIRGGTVDFSDQSLVLPFATKVTAIDATIAGISNDVHRRADVQARGSIQAYGSASVDGSIAPFDPRRYTDLRVQFNNVMVQPFSPYSATFAGRKVQSGKLWLDLNYKIDQGALLGKNEIRLADFSLGERVESPTASSLPLDLAVSLLTDTKGEIHLSVPVRGNLDNPHFEIGGAIAQAFRNTLGRIVTAPFRLLGRLFGGGSDAFDNSIDFAPGSAVLAPDQREKLDALTHALQQRPLLRLVVSAPYAADADTLALQKSEARRILAARLNQPTTNNDASSLVAFDDPATRTALRSMLTKEVGQDPAAVTSLPTSGVDTRAGYEALFERIARQQQLSPEATRILATRRAASIAQFLTENGIERSRVQTGQVKSVSVTTAGKVDAGLQMSAANP